MSRKIPKVMESFYIVLRNLPLIVGENQLNILCIIDQALRICNYFYVSVKVRHFASPRYLFRS